MSWGGVGPLVSSIGVEGSVPPLPLVSGVIVVPGVVVPLPVSAPALDWEAPLPEVPAPAEPVSSPHAPKALMLRVRRPIMGREKVEVRIVCS